VTHARRRDGAPGNTTALVGTPETVAAALLDYVDIGVTTVLIRGYDPTDGHRLRAATCSRSCATKWRGATAPPPANSFR